MVKRWDCTMGATVRETAAGEFVTYDDYATLEAENAKLRAELERRAVDGWKLVPVEPTPEMVSAAEEAYMPFGDMDIALRMAILSAPSAPATAQGGVYSTDPLACSGCVSGCFRCRNSAPKADEPGMVQLLEALKFAAKSLATMTSADGSGHADIALCILRMAGYDDDERERMVDGWKQGTQWRTDAIAAARKGEGE